MAGLLAALAMSGLSSAETLSFGLLDVELDGPVEQSAASEAVDQPPWGSVRITEASTVTEQGVTFRLVRLERPSSAGDPARQLSKVVPTFRRDHKCIVRATRAHPASRRRGRAVPQTTFTGNCAGGERFIERVLVVDGTVYQLYAEARIGTLTRAELSRAFTALLAATAIR